MTWHLLSPLNRIPWNSPSESHHPSSPSHLPRILGTITRDFQNPTNRSPSSPNTPNNPLIKNPGLLQTITHTNFVLNNSSSNSSSLSVQLSALFNTTFKQLKSDSISITSPTLVTSIRMDEEEFYFKTFLNRENSVRESLQDWWGTVGKRRYGGAKEKFPPICLIKGVLVGEEVETEWNRERIAERGAGGEVPLDTVVTVAAGLPLPVDLGVLGNVGVEVAKKETEVKLFRSRQGPGKVIFAVEVVAVEQQMKGWFWERKKEFKLGGGVEPGYGEMGIAAVCSVGEKSKKGKKEGKPDPEIWALGELEGDLWGEGDGDVLEEEEEDACEDEDYSLECIMGAGNQEWDSKPLCQQRPQVMVGI